MKQTIQLNEDYEVLYDSFIEIVFGIVFGKVWR